MSTSPHARGRTLPRLAAAFVLLALPFLAARPLAAHAVVYPKRAALGAYQKYVLRVPSERDTPTTRIEIRFPAGVRVVSFADVPGWKLDVVTDSAGHITGAVWTGSLAAGRFVSLPFIAVNPRTETTLRWPVTQLYADGTRVEWTGPEGAKTPASTTAVVEAGALAGGGGSGGTALIIAIVAGVLALIALGVALRKPEPIRA